MPLVIQQPTGSAESLKHYRDTILRAVPQDRILELAPELGGELERSYGDRPVFVWGVVPGVGDRNVGRWEKLSSGDVALFAGKGRIFGSAVVTFKAHSAPLAVDLWGRDEKGQTWEYLYFLDDVRQLSVPYSVYNAAAGYAANNIIQGFEVLDAGKSRRVMDRLSLDTGSVPTRPLTSEVETAVRTAIEKEKAADKKAFAGATEAADLDFAATAAGRVEQRALRDHLLDRRTEAPCALCGEQLPAGLLTAAHVKRRADCSLQERLDFDHVAMLACRLGCDELFERGYIGVRNGEVVSLERPGRANPTPHLQSRINALVGRPCSHWSDGSTDYFRWHVTSHVGLTL